MCAHFIVLKCSGCMFATCCHTSLCRCVQQAGNLRCWCWWWWWWRWRWWQWFWWLWLFLQFSWFSSFSWFWWWWWCQLTIWFQAGWNHEHPPTNNRFWPLRAEKMMRPGLQTDCSSELMGFVGRSEAPIVPMDFYHDPHWNTKCRVVWYCMPHGQTNPMPHWTLCRMS